MRQYSLRQLFSARATTVAVIICVSTLLFLSQHFTIGTILQSSQRPISQCHNEIQSSNEYRQRLSIVRPLDTVPHSKTLGVAGRIYIVNLADRADRREDMSELGRAMDLEFTWHNATDYHSKGVQDIQERIRWWRNENRVNDSLPKVDPSPFKFQWADDIDIRTGPLGLRGSDLWSDAVGKSPLVPLPPPPSPDNRPPNLDTYGEAGSHFGDATLRPAQLSCWDSHYKVLRRIAEGDEEVAIVFEDDIDMEWDLERRLRGMWGALPLDWDLVMIGHCHSVEWTNPALKGAPTLHPARHTLCTHAYAVTKSAAQRMVRMMRSESFAYSRNVDHAVQHLSSHRHIKVFSIFPPPVVQTYESESDIMPGRPKDRMQWLDDSVRERIELAAQEAAFQAAQAARAAGHGH